MDRQNLSRVIIKDKQGQVVTMCQVRIKSVRALGLRIGYVQWGPLLWKRDSQITCSVEALRQLRQVYLHQNVNVLRIVPNIRDDEMGQLLAMMLREAGFVHIPSVKPYRTFMLQVDDSEENIRMRLRKSFRRDLKKAEQTGIEIRQGHSDEFCKMLEDLYLESLKRKGFKGLNPQEFIKTEGLLSDHEKMNIIAAYLDGEPISVLLASNLGDTAVVLLAASNEKGLACGSSYLIWYRAAISALNAGMKLYDLGGIDPKDNPTVWQFKSRMGGEEIHYIGAFETCTNPRVRTIRHIAERIYNLLKK